MRAPSLPSSEVVCTPSRPKEWQKPKSTEGSMKQHSLASLGLHPALPLLTQVLSCWASSYALRDSREPHFPVTHSCRMAVPRCPAHQSWANMIFSPGMGYESESAFHTPPQQRPAWVAWLQWLDFPWLLSQTYSISPPFSILSSSPLLVMVSWQNLPGSQFQRSWKSSRQ